jgi:H+/Cl- antiporter ClcA
MPANHPEPAPPGTPASPGTPDPVALLRSRSYLILLVLAAILGVPISAAAYGFLALVSYLQKEIFTHLPHGLGFSAEPVWWPLPALAVGGVLAGLAVRYLPGEAGPHRQAAPPFMARRPRLSFPASSARRRKPCSSVPCSAPRRR